MEKLGPNGEARSWKSYVLMEKLGPYEEARSSWRS